jgi:hypothetical protein
MNQLVKKVYTILHPPIIALTNFEYNLLQVGMQVWFDYHLQKRRFVNIFFVQREHVRQEELYM